MAKPWDPLPLPLIGDSSDRVLFEALGRALDRWEYVEVGLSLMYSLFVADPAFEKMRDYGKGNIFKDRLAGLRTVADAWFMKHPNQEVEGHFDRLAVAAKGFADRRNEFAHGVVMDVKDFIFWRNTLKLATPNTTQFLVVPALHVLRNHDATGMPKFGYSSHQLEILYQRIADFEIVIDRFKSRLWPKEWPRRKLPEAPRGPSGETRTA